MRAPFPDPSKPVSPCRRPSLGLLGLALAAWLPAAPGLGLSQGQKPATTPTKPEVKAEELEFELLNGTYVDLANQPAPVDYGPFTIQLTSPSNEFTLARHRLTLTPVGDGSHDAEVEAEFSGRGSLIADVEVTGLSNRFTDQVVVPLQAKRLAGRIQLARDEGGYRLTLVSLAQESVEVAIESQVAGQIVKLCRRLGRFLGYKCVGLEELLSTAKLPLPPPGESFLLRADELTAAEREHLDRIIAQAGDRGR